MSVRSVWSLLLLGACATAAPLSGAAPAPFEATGGFAYRGSGASFSGDRVVSPDIEVSKRSDGSWAGRIGGEVFDVNVRNSGMRGASTLVTWDETPTGVIIDGMLNGVVMHFEVDDKRVLVRTGGGVTHQGTPRSFTLGRLDHEHFQSGFELRGLAAELHPPEPQFALALTGAFFGGLREATDLGAVPRQGHNTGPGQYFSGRPGDN